METPGPSPGPSSSATRNASTLIIASRAPRPRTPSHQASADVVPDQSANSRNHPEHFGDRRDPLLRLLQPVLPQRVHPVGLRRAPDLDRRGALDRHPLDVLRDRHDLVDPDPAAVAGLRTGGAPHRPEDLPDRPDDVLRIARLD